MLNIQKTFKNRLPTMYVVGTPIGNLDDMSKRAIDTLNNVDFICCEDTRTSQAVLQKYNIEKPLISLHKFNEKDRVEKIKELLETNDNLAMISDAGMPTISDPGAVILNILKWDQKVPFNICAVNAGPAYIHAIAMSGFVSKTNFFYGFIENKNATSKQNELKKVIKENKNTIISFYESVHRIKNTVQTLNEVLNSDTQITINREITKLNEEVISGDITSVNEFVQSDEFIEKGEFVLVINNSFDSKKVDDDFIIKRLNEELKNGEKIKAISTKLSKELNVNKNYVYDLYLKMKQS